MGSTPSAGFTEWCNGSTKDFGSFSLGSNPSLVVLPCSTMVVQQTVNLWVIGSSPIGAVLG